MPAAIKEGGFFTILFGSPCPLFFFKCEIFLCGCDYFDGRLMVKGDPNIGIDILTECARVD